MKNRIPPPVIMLLSALLIYCLDVLIPFKNSASTISNAIAGCSLLLALLFLTNSLLGFVRHKTTVNPLKPEKASALVISGVYKFSRNPMYLGMLLLLLALAAYLSNPLGLLPCIVFVVVINKLQIIPEEEALERKFGDSYLNYCQKVRRWL